jgi:uncharacterized protein (TIGR03083 family)
LARLSPDQWGTQSLCRSWTVRQVAAHLILPLEHGMRRFLTAAIRAKGNVHQANVNVAAVEARRPTDELVADLRRLASSRFKPPGLGSEAPLTEILVHGQDIMIPLGVPYERSPEWGAAVLGFVCSPKGRRGFVGGGVPGLRFVASDIGWGSGDGDEVQGPAAALAMSIMGRSERLGDLDGPGARLLADWLVRKS